MFRAFLGSIDISLHFVLSLQSFEAGQAATVYPYQSGHAYLSFEIGYNDLLQEVTEIQDQS